MNERRPLRTLERLRQSGFRTLALLWLVLGAALAHAQDGFLEAGQAFRLQVRQTGGGKLRLHWDIAPGYYLYRDRLAVTAPAGEPQPRVERPPGETKDDPNFGSVAVYHHEVDVEADAGTASAVDITWQGCAERGICYPPLHRSVALQAASTAAQQAAGSNEVAAPPQAAVMEWTDVGISRLWSGRSLGWTLPAALLLGIALAFTPCMLPMLPIVSAMVVGQHGRARRAFALSLAFVLPMAMVYAVLGVLAALAGANLQAWLQTPALVLAFSALFVVLAASMFGFFELQLPALLRDRLSKVSPAGGSLAGAAAMGVVSALLVGPCMTAPLAGTLLYIAQGGNVVQGGLLLLALGLGMGIPLVVVSTAGARWLPRPGAWMDRVKAAFGFAMLAMAVWMAQRVLPGPATLLLWGALLAAFAVTLWQLQAPGVPASSVALRSTAVVAGAWAVALVLGSAAGATDPVHPLARLGTARAGGVSDAADFEIVHDPAALRSHLDAAQARGKPVLLDFSADWCTSCKTIDREVFADARVKRALGDVVRLRADVTAGSAPQQQLMRELQVMGPPTVMLFDAHGSERRADRLVGEFEPDALLERLAALRGRS